MQEEFKNISGYSDDYSISNFGRVISNKRNKLIELLVDVSKHTHTSYYRVTLCRNGLTRRFLVHRLVAEAFITNPLNKPHINHIDNDGSNNHVSNLEWVTASENMQHSVKQGRQVKSQTSATKIATIVNDDRYAKTYEERFGNRFIAYFRSKQIKENDNLAKPTAAIIYTCAICGIERLASVGWAEIVKHNGVCPNCTNTIHIK